MVHQRDPETRANLVQWILSEHQMLNFDGSAKKVDRLFGWQQSHRAMLRVDPLRERGNSLKGGEFLHRIALCPSARTIFRCCVQ